MVPDEHQRHGDFLRQFVTHEGAIHTYVRSLVPNRADANEVMQEVVVVLWSKFQTFDRTGDFRKWAFGVVRYEVLALLRDRARDRHVFGEALLLQLAQEAEEFDQEREEQRAALTTCLERLPPSQRDLVVRAYQPDMRIASLAEETGQSEMALYKTLHRCRVLLIACTKDVLRPA